MIMQVNQHLEGVRSNTGGFLTHVQSTILSKKSPSTLSLRKLLHTQKSK